MLRLILETIPQGVAWKNQNSEYIGCNLVYSRFVGISISEIIGRTDFEMPLSRNLLKIVREEDHEVLKRNQPILNIYRSFRRTKSTNSAFQRMLGYSAEELAQLTLNDITYPEDLEQSRKKIEQIDTGKADNYQIEKRYIRKDGVVIWIKGSGSVVKDARGRIEFAMGAVIDITEQKQAFIKELQAREEAEKTIKLRDDFLPKVSVRDHGIGLTKEDQNHLFERFERGVSIHHYGGFGLGLYITKKILEKHGGTIHCESAPSAGTLFTLELPLEK